MDDDKRYGKPLDGKDTVLILFGLSSMFGILNFRMLVDKPNISVLGGLMTLVFVIIWLYFAFSSGWNKNRGFLVAVGIIWGVSLIYLVWNYLTGGQLFPKDNQNLAAILSSVAFIMLLFATATVVPLFQGLGNLGFLLDSPGRLLLACIISILVLLGVFFIGYIVGKRRPALNLRFRKQKK